MIRAKRQAAGLGMTNRTDFGNIQRLNQIDSDWSNLDQIGPNFTTLDKIAPNGPNWTILEHFSDNWNIYATTMNNKHARWGSK